ncbi:unnamed protein product [Sphagnum jensenii]|uniref:phosphoribosylaminoimidazole carboxylase n=1 Tax=Sphagnum jensenii TaxID=128206 RepID=A0ABP1BN40_9BRYO
MGVLLCPSQAFVVASPTYNRSCNLARASHEDAASLSTHGISFRVSGSWRRRQVNDPAGRRRRIERGFSTMTTFAAAMQADVLDSAAEVKPAAAVGIIMGSDSDLPVMQSAAEILQLFGIAYELTVVSAHRTPERMVKYAQTAHQRGLRVIIAGAGGAAHLPGMVASLTPLPVIGVPVKGSATDGLDSLLSIVQMPRGIPVATVAIQNATNAGLLAVRILGLSSPELVDKMLDYQKGLEEMVLEKAERLEQLGWQEYLKQQQ